MIPSETIDQSLILDEAGIITTTYNTTEIDIQGFIDELEALRQTVLKELLTDRYEYEIYSFDYGIELSDLISKDFIFVKAELKRRIKECLEKYAEISSAGNFKFDTNGDALLCTFDIDSIYGTDNITLEVNI